MPPGGILQITNRYQQHQWLLLFSIAYSGSWPRELLYEIHEQDQNGQRTMTSEQHVKFSNEATFYNWSFGKRFLIRVPNIKQRRW